jgi:polyisoprenyl-teichoic acid--peptidoglycan teichoic acid transferase
MLLASAATVAFLTLAVTALATLRLRTAPAAAQDTIEIHSAHGASFVPALQGKRPMFILILGSDARPGQRVDRERADSIHIIGIDTARHRASVLGFPRDSWVGIPGHGTTKINNAMAFGGPQLMVRTIERITGIRIDFWVLTSFIGVNRLVDGIGGLTVRVPYPMHDRYSHANLRAGTHRLRGWQALAMARNRHDTPNGDFSRSQNQGRLFLAALGQLQREFKAQPARLFKWVAVGWRNIRTDLRFGTLVDLGLTATQIPPSKVNNLVVPGRNGFAGGASVVYLTSGARAIFRDLRQDGFIGTTARLAAYRGHA